MKVTTMLGVVTLRREGPTTVALEYFTPEDCHTFMRRLSEDQVGSAVKIVQVSVSWVPVQVETIVRRTRLVEDGENITTLTKAELYSKDSMMRVAKQVSNMKKRIDL